jgi:hypothetical protein
MPKGMIEVLQVSFVGIAAVFGLLAFWLVLDLVRKDAATPEKRRLIYAYMAFAFALGALSIGAEVFDSADKRGVSRTLEARLKAIEVEGKRTAALAASASARAETANSRISDLGVVGVDAGVGAAYACSGTDKAEAQSARVMYGIRDGTSCKTKNVNYYKDLKLVIPEDRGATK